MGDRTVWQRNGGFAKTYHLVERCSHVDTDTAPELPVTHPRLTHKEPCQECCARLQHRRGQVEQIGDALGGESGARQEARLEVHKLETDGGRR